MSRPARKRITESFAITLVLMIVFLGTAVLGQVRQVDQGRAGTTTAQVWLVKICDSAGANCGTVAIPVTITGTLPVTGTVQSNAGTGTVNVTCISGCGGAATFSDAAAFSFGSTPIGNIGAVVDDVATNTVAENSAAIPRMSSNRVLFFDLKNTQTNTNALTVTGTVQNNGGTVTATPTGTTTVAGTLTGVTGTFTANPAGTTTITGSITNTVTISPTTFTAAQGAASATGWPVTQSGAWGVTASMASGTNSIGAITNTGFAANAGTGTFATDLEKVLGSALSTANPDINGGRASTDTTASVANGAVVALRLSKFGDIIVALAPPDLTTASTTAVTATTAAQILASSGGAGYKWAITSITVCNLTSTVATNLNVLDSAGTLFVFPFTESTSAAGEARCIPLQFPTPYYSAANTTISVQLTTSNSAGVRTNITAFKTGT